MFKLLSRIALPLLLSTLIPLREAGGQSYCSGSGSKPNYEWISEVDVNGVKNASGPLSYSSFTQPVFNLTAGKNQSIILTPGFSSSSFTENWAVWIDFNGDFVFDDATERVFAWSQALGRLAGSFAVPSGARSGLARMRVRMSYSSITSPCGPFTYGEVEDYSVNIVPQTVLPTSGTFLDLESEAGHWIGQGIDKLFTKNDGTFTIRPNYNNDPKTGAYIAFETNDKSRYYHLQFDAPNGQILKPGIYRNATRFPFNASTEPGLAVHTNGRGCNTVKGEFTVFEAIYGSNGLLTSFAATFNHYCEGTGPLLKGTIFYNIAEACGRTGCEPPLRDPIVFDFQELTPKSILSAYKSKDFTISSSYMTDERWSIAGSTAPSYAYLGSAAMSASPLGVTMSLRRNVNLPFDLSTIDLSTYINTPSHERSTVTFAGELASGGTVFQSFNVVGFGLKKFYFSPSFKNLKRVTWDHTGPANGHQFDNIVLYGDNKMAPITFDFEEHKHSGTFKKIGTYKKLDYILDSERWTGNTNWIVRGAADGAVYNTGSTTLTSQYTPARQYIRRDDFGVFDFLGISLSYHWSGLPTGTPTVTFVGTRADGSKVTQTIEVKNFGLKSHTMNGFTNVVKVEWDNSGSNSHQFDNVIIRPK